MTPKEKKVARRKAYREANKEKLSAQKKAYYEANKEKISAQKKAYHEANKEKLSAQKKAYCEANKEKISARTKAYREANKEKISAQKRKRFLEKMKCPQYREVRRYTAAKTRAEDPARFKKYREAYTRRVGSEHRRRRDWGRRGMPSPTRPRPPFCEICGRPPEGRGGNAQVLHLDHCHETGAFRGWLCTKCNLALGALGDNIEGLRKALAYLERFEKEQANVIA